MSWVGGFMRPGGVAAGIVRPVPVVVDQVLLEHEGQVPFVEDQESHPGDAVTHVHCQVAGLQHGPCSGRVGGYSGQVQ